CLEGNRGFGTAEVEYSYGNPSVGQRLYPDLLISIFGNARRLFAQTVLVDGDHIAIEEDVLCRLRHAPEIVTCQQRSRKQAPQAHVSSVLLVCHASIADLKHVGIIPVSRRSLWGQIILVKSDLRHTLPVVADIAGRTPQICTYSGSPRLHIAQA